MEIGFKDGSKCSYNILYMGRSIGHEGCLELPLPLKGQNHNHAGVHGRSFTDCDVDWDFALFGAKIFVALHVHDQKCILSGKFHTFGVTIENCIHICARYIPT